MRINNNLLAINTHRQMGITQSAQTKSMEKLSSGYRINRAGDDAAGLAISEKMRAQIRGLSQASRNSQDAISLIQTAEGALNETQNILQRMRELAVQSANDTNVDADREEIQKEISQLTSEMNRIGNTTEFNTMKLLDGSRVIETSTSVGASTVQAVAQNYTVNHTTGITKGAEFATAGGSFTLNGTNKVTIDDTEPNWNQVGTTTGTSTIKILKTTDGELDVEITVLAGTGNATVLSVADTITADADGNYVYNANGVSFTVSAEDYTNMGDVHATDNSITLDVLAADITAGEKAILNDFTTNTVTAGGTNYAAMTAGITITSDADASARKVVISSTVDFTATSGGGTVNIYIQNSAGDNISADTYTVTAGGQIGTTGAVLEYDNHGVQFTLDLKNTSAVLYEKTLDTESIAGASTTTVVSDNTLNFQVGANQDQQLNLSIADMRASALGVSASAGATLTYTKDDGSTDTIDLRTSMEVNDGTSSTGTQYAIDVTSFDNASKAVTVFNNAIKAVSTERSKLGAVQNRLEHTIANLDTSAENLQASESRIRDVDMAKEMMAFSRNNILQQAAQSMLAQANQAPQGVLQLLR